MVGRFATITLSVAVGANPTLAENAIRADRDSRVPAITFAMIDLTGRAHQLGQNDKRRLRVYVFLSTECPIANSYTKTLNALYRRLQTVQQAIDFFGVVSDPTLKRNEAIEHYREFGVIFPILFDALGELSAVLRPTHTPEAFVLDGDGKLVYRGKIDDAYKELGRRRPQVQHSYLAHAIDAAVQGQPVSSPYTKP